MGNHQLTIGEVRTKALDETLAVIHRVVGPLAKSGFWGTIPLAIVMRDGVVEVLHSTGPSETHKIARPAA